MGESVTVKDAAQKLGVTPKTIRRRLRAGTLMGTKYNGVWHIDLADEDIAQAKPQPMGDDERVAVLRAQLDEVRAERDYLRQALALSLDPPRALQSPRHQQGVWARFRVWLFGTRGPDVP